MCRNIKPLNNFEPPATEDEIRLAVTAVPDEKKGERLGVLHKLEEARLKECLEKVAQTDLPNLWKPRGDQFVRVEAIPYLGTGKLNLQRVLLLDDSTEAAKFARHDERVRRVADWLPRDG